MDENLIETAEVLKVLEDLAAFALNCPDLPGKLRNMRQSLKAVSSNLLTSLIISRDLIKRDYNSGFKDSGNVEKSSIRVIASNNFKMVQESLRSLEEISKISGFDDISGSFKASRQESYELEKNFFSMIAAENRRSVLDTDIYCITAHEHSRGRSNIEVVEELLAAGIKLVQYREKDKTLRQKYNECREIRRMTMDFGARFIVNDDVELAVMVEADGVHIGQDDFPVHEVRKIVGESMAIGLSTHSPLQAESAIRDGVDYIGVGPIFRTYTKKDVCDPVGFDYLEYVVKNVNIPFVAIGGIKAHNISEVVRRGAGCVALVTEIVGAEDIRRKIEELRETINQAKGLNI